MTTWSSALRVPAQQEARQRRTELQGDTESCRPCYFSVHHKLEQRVKSDLCAPASLQQEADRPPALPPRNGSRHACAMTLWNGRGISSFDSDDIAAFWKETVPLRGQRPG
jgi:hypothetical protein